MIGQHKCIKKKKKKKREENKLALNCLCFIEKASPFSYTQKFLPMFYNSLCLYLEQDLKYFMSFDYLKSSQLIHVNSYLNIQVNEKQKKINISGFCLEGL